MARLVKPHKKFLIKYSISVNSFSLSFKKINSSVYAKASVKISLAAVV